MTDPKKSRVRTTHLPGTDKYPPITVSIRDQPKEPTRTEERNGWRYYFNDVGGCYGVEKVEFDDGPGNFAPGSMVILPKRPGK